MLWSGITPTFFNGQKQNCYLALWLLVLMTLFCQMLSGVQTFSHQNQREATNRRNNHFVGLRTKPKHNVVMHEECEKITSKCVKIDKKILHWTLSKTISMLMWWQFVIATITIILTSEVVRSKKNFEEAILKRWNDHSQKCNLYNTWR